MTVDGGLDVTQGPSGELYTAKHKAGKLRVLVPIEPPSDALSLISVFPRRGHISGGTTLRVYGKNFDLYGVPVVQVGDAICSIASLGPSHATCILPPGSGRADVSMFAGNQTSVLLAGYRYITGSPPVAIEPSTQAPSSNHSTGFPSASPSTSPAPALEAHVAIARLNAGGGAYVDSNGNSWEADLHYSHGASGASQTNHSIANTNDEQLFQSSRFFRRHRQGPFFYEIPVPLATNYTVVLGFAEIVDWRTEAGDRRMIIAIENDTVLDGFDVVAAAGAAYTATYMTFNTSVHDGNVTVVFTPSKFNPTVSTIEVFMAP
jgi:hypothetical protein